jgi:putative ABC transport system permease protein
MDRRLAPYGVFATTERARQVSHLSLAGEMQGLRTMAVVMPTLFLGVGALVLNTLVASAVRRQRTVIGTLKALGYTDRAVSAHFVKFAVIVGLAGSLLGSGLGYALAGYMTEMYRTKFFKFPDLVNIVYPHVMLVGVVLSVGCAALGALRGARLAMRLDPAEAMRPPPPKAGHRVALERWSALWTRLGFVWQTVLRNVMRERGRSASGACAALIGTVLLVMTLYFGDAFDHLIDFEYQHLLVSDYTLVLQDNGDRDALRAARRLPGVIHAEPVFNVACTFDSGRARRKGAIQGLPAHSVLTVPSDTTGRRLPLPTGGLLLSRRMADVLGVVPGDAVHVTPVRGRRDTHTVPVAGVMDTYFGMAVYADFDWLNRLVGETGAVNAVQLKTTWDARDRRALYRAVKDAPAVQAIRSARENRAALLHESLGPMRVMRVVLILFAGLIFFGSILNAALISLSERRREIATYRVLGYTAAEIGRIFLRESLVVNLAGATVGLAVGYWAAMSYGLSFDFDTIRFPLMIRPASFVWAWMLGLLFTLLAHLPVQGAIRRLDWLEALNIRE